MIKKLKSDRKVRRITRSVAKLYIDLTWIDEPLFWQNKIDKPSSSVSHITEKFLSEDHKSWLWHKWGFVGDEPVLREYLKEFLPHETEEQYAQNVHDLVCNMFKKGYLEFTPQSYIGSRYVGEVNDVGNIRITQSRGSSVTGNHLSLSPQAFSLPSNDLMHFVSLLSTFLVSHATALILIILALLQIIEIASNLGIEDWIRTFIQ